MNTPNLKEIRFYHDNNILCILSSNGYHPGEATETRDLLAYEKGVDKKEIKVTGLWDDGEEIPLIFKSDG